MSSEQPKEYIITDKMIKAWRNECVKGIQIKFDDSRCLGCEFCGTGARYHCCDFDDVDVEQMFRSRPHTPAPRPPCEECIYQAQPSEAQQRVDTEQDVIDAATNWWMMKRPLDFSEEQHMSNPKINCVTSQEDALADALALLQAGDP